MEDLGLTHAVDALPDSAFWRHKRVLVTGHTGFKGGWLCLWLDRLGATVAGYALPPPTEPNLFTLCGLEALVDHRIGDVRDLPALQRALDAFQPEIVFHMAAQPLVRASYMDPVGTYATNVMGTVHLLEAARTVPSLRSVVVVTSDKCYAEDPERLPYREDDKMGGRDPYSSSKGSAELVTDCWARSFLSGRGCAVASVRAGNVIGGGDWAEDRLVADILRAFLDRRAALLRNPDAIRPWQHVLDPLCGYLLAAERLHHTGPTVPASWNFGPDAASEVRVRDVAVMLRDLWGNGAAVNLAEQAGAPHEAAVLRLCSDKARKELGWSPRWSLDLALARTVDWFRAYARGEGMAVLSRRQIDEYAATAAKATR